MIIGLSGKIGTGKTTLADYLISKMNNYIKKSYGDFLKQTTSKLFKYPLMWNYTVEGKNNIVKHAFLPNGEMTVRQLLQWYGTDVIRKQNPGYWVKCMDEFLLTNKNVIIDDVRFPDEAELVIKHKGIVIRLDPYSNWEEGKYANHESETALDNYTRFDFIYKPNFGGLEVIADNIIDSLKEVL